MLSQLIGATISSVRYNYIKENEYGLQEFQSFFKLSDGSVTEIPFYPEEVFLVLNDDNEHFLKGSYDKGQEITEEGKAILEGAKIEDFYFCEWDGEIDLGKRAYVKLNNGYYITEVNYGPGGLTNVDLLILDEQQFKDRVYSLNEQLKSYIKELKK
jgi:hypothetical protein